METPQHETLAGRLNSEPVVYQGCTSSEMITLLIAATAFWLPLSLLVALAVGYWLTVVLGGLVLGVSVTMYFAPKRFQNIKRGRPDGYYQQRGILALARLGLRPSIFITRSGLWGTGRSH